MRWHDRFVNDELWLRSRRVLLAHLREIGLDSGYEEYRRFMHEQHALGTTLVSRMSHWLGDARAAEIGHEAFLGAGHRHFRVRLPFILAFMAEYGRWLDMLSPARGPRPGSVPEIAALFNLGIVLVDQIADEPDQRGDLAQVFGDGRLDRLVRDAVGSAELLDRIPSFSTPELRVLAAIVSAFFRGVDGFAGGDVGGELHRCFAGAIARAFAGQVAVAAGAREEATLRAKSVTPFVIPPVLTRLAAGASGHPGLVELGEHIGEVFWRVDDLIDTARDFFGADGNLLLVRSGVEVGANRRLAAVLEAGNIEALAAEAADHARVVIELIDDVGDARIRECAVRWLEMYVVDWMR